MARQDDLTAEFTGRPQDLPAQPQSYRQGVIVTFDQTNLSNTVKVGRTLFANLRVLGLAEAASYRPGTVVGIMVVGSTWAIVGQLVEPGTDEAIDAITQFGRRRLTAFVATSESTDSATFIDLTTPGPSIPNVIIPASGKVEVGISARVFTDADAVVGVEISGAAVVAPDDQKALVISLTGSTSFLLINATRVVTFDGLPPGGVCTFTLKYQANGVDDAFFAAREIAVQAL